MKSLVTGGAGFVGRHLIEELLKRGDQVVCVDPLVKNTGALPVESWYFNPREYQSFTFIQEDCRDYFKKNEEFDYAFHLAAIVGGRLIIEYDPIAVAQDLSIDAEFWRYAVKTKPKVVTFSSSAAYPIEYQKQDFCLMLSEEMIDFSNLRTPDMTYGWAKLTSEYLGLIAYQKHDVKSVAFRPFSGYGNDQSLQYPFPKLINEVKRFNGKNIPVWGPGTQLRDFIHIDDCIQGVLHIVDKINDASAVNLSTGIYTSFIELCELAGKVLQIPVYIRPEKEKPVGVYARAGSTVKQKELGFSAKISLEEGIRRFYAQ